MAEEKEKRTASITFENVSDAPQMPVTGVWGGVANDGTVWAALFHEHGTIPNVITFDVDEEGRGDPNAGERVMRGDVTRDVQAIANMSPETALSIGIWLIEKAKQAVQNRSPIEDINFELKARRKDAGDSENGQGDQRPG